MKQYTFRIRGRIYFPSVIHSFRISISNVDNPRPQLRAPHHHANLPPSLQIQRPGVRTRVNQGAKRPRTLSRRFFRLRYRFMAAVRGRPSGLPVALIAGFSPCAQLPPQPVRRFVAPQIKELSPMCCYVYRTKLRHPSKFISSVLGGAV